MSVRVHISPWYASALERKRGIAFGSLKGKSVRGARRDPSDVRYRGETVGVRMCGTTARLTKGKSEKKGTERSD
jgi:hypothetical protein